MNSLTTEQIARVFHVYHGTPLFALHPFEYWNDDEGQHVEKIIPAQVLNVSNYHRIYEHIDDNTPIRLILLPLSAITDEDAVEVACICHAISRCQLPEGLYIDRKVNEWNKGGFAQLKSRKIKIHEFDDDSDRVIISFCSDREFLRAWQGVEYFSTMTEAFQYLIQQGYAVPLFIAPGHPDNGKTAIELGLAIAL